MNDIKRLTNVEYSKYANSYVKANFYSPHRYFAINGEWYAFSYHHLRPGWPAYHASLIVDKVENLICTKSGDNVYHSFSENAPAHIFHDTIQCCWGWDYIIGYLNGTFRFNGTYKDHLEITKHYPKS